LLHKYKKKVFNKLFGILWLHFNEAKRLFINVLCGFVPSKKLRFRIRARALFPVMKDYNLQRVITSKQSTAGNTVYPSSINIAFCFDENVMEQAKTAVTSLLCSASPHGCNIYCIVQKNFQQSFKSEVQNIVKKQGDRSSITFLEANNDFNQSCIWKETQAIYYRLMLPHLLPDLDKIIYADVDVIFHNNLAEVDQVDLGSSLVAGVKDILNVSSIWRREKSEHFKRLTRGQYINSGFLVLNLKELRKGNIYDQWITLSNEIGHRYPDQNILNYTCAGRKLFLPLKYNFIPQVYTRALLENVYSLEEYNEAVSHPVMIHYAGQSRSLWERSSSYLKKLEANDTVQSHEKHLSKNG
jgi:lipopolysaccharide biosynthesis glycosyltransferase